MSTRHQTEFTAQFDPDADARDLQLLIEDDPLAPFSEKEIALLLFPVVDAQVSCDLGSVRTRSSKSVAVAGGIVEMNGTSVTRLPKRPLSAPELRVLRASDANGSPAAISIGLDTATGTIRANTDCVAAIAYGPYRAEALELIYTPLVESYGGGMRTTFGTVVAFYPPRSQTMYAVQPYSINEGEFKVELYRIVSSSVTNRDGAFEKPPGYPATGTYPDRSLVLDTSMTLETQRVHEVGYMDMRRGYGWADKFMVRNLEPYIESTSYVPVKTMIKSTLPKDKFTPEEIAKAENFIKRRGFGAL